METELRDIIRYGTWAPSGDNSQPWHFKIQGDKILVYIYPNKDNPILNWKLSGTYIATGALIENMVIAATHYGFDTNVTFLPEKNDVDCVAKMVFSKINLVENPLFPYIKSRGTNRKPYNKTSLTAKQKELLL